MRSNLVISEQTTSLCLQKVRTIVVQPGCLSSFLGNFVSAMLLECDVTLLFGAYEYYSGTSLSTDLSREPARGEAFARCCDGYRGELGWVLV